MFQVIDDLEQADKLWAAGLLWVRSDSVGWQLDCTYNDPRYAPSKDATRIPENTYQYAILIED